MPQAARASAAVGLRRFLLSLILVGAMIYGGWWLMREQRMRWIIEEGKATIIVDAGQADLSRSVERWVAKTQPAWPRTGDALIAALLDEGPARSRVALAMLERVADASYGEREADWRRWESSRERAREGQQDFGPRAERLALKLKWEAAVGLTSWFSNMIALDGELYLASLGSAFGQAADGADGIVKIDGKTGKTELIAPPPLGGAADVLGVSAGAERVFASCANGVVFCVDRQAQLKWAMRAGEGALSGPLTVDVDRDGALDVLVVNHENRVVAVGGDDGRVLWRSNRLDAVAAEDGAVLSAATGDIWVTLASGFVGQLAPASGALRWSGRVPGGCLSGVTPAWPGSAAAGYLADRSGRVWSILSGRGAPPALVQVSSADARGRSSFAAVRILRPPLNQPEFIISALTGGYDSGTGALLGIRAAGGGWRFPTDAAQWSTPALADLNRVGGSEIVCVGMLPPASETAAASRGRLRVLSSDGHVLRQMDLPAASECSPLLVDVDGDHRTDLLIADQSGMLRCYDTFSGGAIEWGSMGGDPHNTRGAEAAYSFGQTVFGRQWQWRPPK